MSTTPSGATGPAASAIEQIASAVLYEGFLLYPYRLSSVKNRHRWNFGVLYPEPFAGEHAERAMCQTEFLVAMGERGSLGVKVRFLELANASAVEREVDVPRLEFEMLPREAYETPFRFDAEGGRVEVRAKKIRAGLLKVTVGIFNLGRFSTEDRDAALTHAFISTHVILAAEGGRFISLIDPAEEFRTAAEACRQIGLWPVLAGHEDTELLAAPIILHDHPKIAPHSPGDLFDNTEIDEILTLRIRTLTDGEKQEMRAADWRTRAMLERSEALTREELAKLHAPMQRGETRNFKKGDRVRLRPRRRADIFDVVLAGKLATVVSVEQDFEDGLHACVTVDEDPGRDLGAEGKPGHRFFFGMDELEPA